MLGVSGHLRYRLLDVADIGCSLNAAIAFDFFVKKGLRDYQAAAVVGNLQQESRIDPTENTGDEGTARGIAQWHGTRWKNLLKFAELEGTDPLTLRTQLEFIWYELETVPSAGLAELNASTSLEDAVRVFQDLFERCGVCGTNARIAYARAALYACPRVELPKKKSGIFLAAAGAIAVIGAAGYGALEALRFVRKRRR